MDLSLLQHKSYMPHTNTTTIFFLSVGQLWVVSIFVVCPQIYIHPSFLFVYSPSYPRDVRIPVSGAPKIAYAYG